MLNEAYNANGEHLWWGHMLTSISPGSNDRYLLFPGNLPSQRTAGTYVLVATQAFADLGLIVPDFILPPGFLPTGSAGTIDFAGVDAMTYMSLPTDGSTAQYRTGPGPAIARNFAGDSVKVNAAAPPPPAAIATQTAVEYFHAEWNHYFMTAFADEIALLDGGAYGGVWKRTGETFKVWAAAGTGTSPTCRFFSTSFTPRSSHFYTPFPGECTSVKASPDWQYESIAFHIGLASADGTCGSGLVPLYRAYNNGMSGAPNHRYTVRLDVLDAMVAAGGTFEGDGRTRVFACVPQ